MLECKNIYASYHDGFEILSDISFSLEAGEKMAVLGRNGAGKTTLANSLFGLLPNIQGEIKYNGHFLKGMALEKIQSLGIGYFMQGASVFPQMSLKENLQISAGKSGKQQISNRIEALKEFFPILQNYQILQMPAGALSGGELTQLALAMALFNKPSLLILDEPFAGLSPGNAKLVLNALLQYHESYQTSILLIAQDRHLADAFCSKHFIIRDGGLVGGKQ